jgi:hypothetical protein
MRGRSPREPWISFMPAPDRPYDSWRHVMRFTLLLYDNGGVEM